MQRVRESSPNFIKRVFLQDSASSTGAGKTGLTSASAGLNISVIRELDAAATTYTSAGSTTETITTLGTYAAPTSTKCRFKEVDATNLPGVYEIHLAQALLGTGDASRMLNGCVQATGIAPCLFEIDLTAVNPQSATAFITGVNSLAPPTNWNLASIDGNGRVDVIKLAGTTQTARDLGASVLLSSGTGTGQLDFTGGVVKANAVQLLGTAWLTPGTAGTPDVNAKLIGATAQTGLDLGANWTAARAAHLDADISSRMATFTPLTAAQIATGVWQDATGADFTASGSIGKSLFTSGAVPGAAGGLFIAGSNAGTTVNFTGNITGNLVGTVSTLTTYTGNTPQTGDAYARLGAPAGASVSADVAAVKTDTAAIKAKTDNLPSDPADASDIAGAFSTVNGTLGTIAGYIDTEVAAIKAKTDNLPASPAAVGSAMTLATDSVDAAALKSDAVDEIVAGVLAGTGDTGITLAKALEMLAAFMNGKVSKSVVGSVATYTWKMRDGTTTSFTSACSTTDGTRSTTGALS